MSAEFRPHGLRAWVTLLDEALLPVLPVRLKSLKAIIKGDDFGLADLAGEILLDPVMMVHVIREVNRTFKGKVEGSLTDIHHCLALLGEPRALRLISQFRAISGNPENQAEVAYQASIQQSLFAAELVRCWHRYRTQPAPEQTYLATVLSGVPNWCLWRFANKEMRIIDTLQKKELIPKQAAEQSVMGCTTADVVLGLASRWYFPDMITDALDQQTLPSLRFFAEAARRGRLEKEPRLPRIDNGRLVNAPAMPLVLANWLAHEVMVDWYSPQTRRCLAIVAAYLGVDITLSRKIAQNAALSVGVKSPLQGVLSAAATLVYPPLPARKRRIRDADLKQVVDQLHAGKRASQKSKPDALDEPTKTQRRLVNKDKPAPVVRSLEVPVVERSGAPILKPPPLPKSSEVTERKVKPVRPPPPKVSEPEVQPERATAVVEPARPPSNYHEAGFVSEERQKLFTQYFQRLSKQIGYYQSEFEVLRDAIDALGHCTRMKRIIGAQVDVRNQVIKGYYSRGADEYPDLKELYLSLQPPNFFTGLIARPQCQWVTPAKFSEMGAKFPGVFKRATEVEEFIVGTLFNHSGVFAMLYVDKGVAAQDTFSSAEFQLVRAVVNACTKHLVAMAQRPKGR